MIYSINESIILLEANVSLDGAVNDHIKSYKLNFYNDRGMKHGPRVKVYKGSELCADYAINRNTGVINRISKNTVDKKDIPYFEFYLSEITYACIKLITKMIENPHARDRTVLTNYINIIIKAPKNKVHDVAEAVRRDINDKIF